MKRKITTVLLAMLLVIGAAIGLCACADQKDIDNALLPVEQQVTLINTTLDDMKATDKTLNDSITALTGRVSTLEGELETAKNNIGSVSSALTQEIADRKADIKTLQEQDAALKAQITALETALAEKEQGIKDWANGAFVTVTAWNEFKTQINTTIAGLTSKIETLESSVGKINSTLTEMKATDKTLNDSITALTGRVSTLEGELETAQNSIGSVSSALTQEIADRKADIKTLQEQDTALKAQIAALETALTNQEQSIKDWANGVFMTISDWTAFKNEINTTIAGLTGRIETLESSVGKINSTLTEMKATDASLKNSIDGLTTRVTALEAELVEVNTKITSLQTDSATKAELENVKTALQNQIDALNAEITALKAKDAELQGQITALQSSLTSEITDVKTWANDTFLSIANWNTAKEEIDDKISALRDRVVVIEDTLEMMNNVISALQQQVEQNKQDIADLTIRVNCLEGKHVAEVIDETTYSWSDDFTTCTVKGICKYCGARHDITENTTHEGYIYKVSFINGKYTHQIDLVNLTDMDSTLQEKALSFLLAAQPSTLTLTLPKDFSSFSFISDPIKNYDDGKYIDLTLKGVETIAANAFNNNSHLKFIHLPDATEIGSTAFHNCDKLMDISAEKVKKLGDGAFWGCTSLTEIELPSVTSIGNSVFYNTYIERIKFGSVIKELGIYIFLDIDVSKSVLIFAEGQKKFTGSDSSGWVESSKTMTSSDTEFVGNTFKKIFVGDVPECTTHDAEVVYKWSVDFKSCTAVSECKNCFRTFADETATDDKISLNGFVYTATFESALFSTTTLDLTDLTNFNESQYEERLEFVFSQKNADVTLTLPKDFAWDDWTDSIKTIINKYYADGTLNLTLKGVEKIKRLGSIHALKTINFPDAIEICNGALYTCSKLTQVTANNVTKIGTKAFYQCAALTNVNIPKVTEIGDQAFYWCSLLNELKFESASMKIGANAFENCEGLTKIEFSGVITEIGTDAFKNANTTNCTLTLAKGQKDFTSATDGNFTISDTEVVAGTNKAFCGYTFKEIIIAEE